VTRVAIIGAGNLGVQLAHHLGAVGGLDAVGFFDDSQDPGGLVSGLPVLGPIDDVATSHAAGVFDALLMGIGYHHMQRRAELHETLRAVAPFATLVHPTTILDVTAQVAQGAVIYPGGIVDLNARIGANTLLNVGCLVAHDSTIGDNCFLSPGVAVAGFVTVEDGVVLGIGTVVIDNVRIASGVRTGAGAVVTRDLLEPGLYVGIPATLKKRLKP